MNFADAVNNMGKTDNGLDTFVSSLNANVDLFFLAGASRNKNINDAFDKALNENADIALRTLLHTRDVRGGIGERQTFRNLLTHLEKTHPEYVKAVLPKIPEVGRWDDLLHFESSEIQNKAFALIADALHSGNALAAKWMPRKGPVAAKLRNFMKLSPKAYRKMLVRLTNVVETKMCSKQWNTINFEHVPSVASARYTNAFKRNAAEEYQQYLDSVASGEKKINASAVMPYDVVRAVKHGDKTAADLQWKALPNYLDANTRILPMVDVSGSMDVEVSGSVTAMDVAISVGIYIAEKQSGAFKNLFCTFSNKPKLLSLEGDTLSEIVSNMEDDADWGLNTNINAAFEEILKVAVMNNVPQSEMPEYLMILSDMEFDEADKKNSTAFNLVEDKYKSHGYNVPKVVFWNINGKAGNVPVRFDQNGTALVSGCSPSILKSIMNCKDINPEKMMLDTVMKDRYKVL